MNLSHKWARMSADRTVVRHVKACAERVITRLRGLDLASLGISDYIQKYLGGEITQAEQAMPVNVYMLAALLTRARRNPKDLTFVDYGGGPGTVSFIAKEAGIGTVVYLDIYDISCRDAAAVGKAAGCAADHHVLGELADLVRYMREHNLRCDLLGSHNCIEHIYDVPTFLRQLKALDGGGLTLWLSSGANPHFGHVRRRLMKYQIQRDTKGRPFRKGDKLRDTPRSFCECRRELITKYKPDLPRDVVESLAKLTRGMNQADIRAAVDNFARTGQLPPPPTHPTNTCDPFTGNWCEQLMDPYELADIMRQDGYRVDVLPGYWGRWSSRPVRSTIARGLNIAVSCLPRRAAMKLAPYYALVACT